MSQMLIASIVLFIAYSTSVEAIKCYYGNSNSVEELDCASQFCVSYEYDSSKVHPLLREGFDQGLGTSKKARSCDTENRCGKQNISPGSSKILKGLDILVFGNAGVVLTPADMATDVGSIEALVEADRKNPNDAQVLKKTQIAIYRDLTLTMSCCTTDLCNQWRLSSGKNV